MKNFLLLIIVITSLFSCKKYEEGPIFSLRTKKSRLVNEWKLLDAIAGIDLYWKFEKNGKCTQTINSLSFDGTWNFEDNKESLAITFNGKTESSPIIKLTKDELWLKDLQGNTVKLIPK